jgi:hypothetical protein
MTAPTQKTAGKLIHVALIMDNGSWRPLFLRKIDDQHFAWFAENSDGTEEKTLIDGINTEVAIQKAYPFWKHQYIKMLNCGFKYQLPERDEHGINALFWEMVAGYTSPNGIYFDQVAGSNFFVNFASQHALKMWKSLEKQGRL